MRPVWHGPGDGASRDEAVAVAAYAALTGVDFADVMARAANHDGDSDSTASIAGQLWGACYGVDGMPHDWIERLDVLDELLGLVQAAVSLPPRFAEPTLAAS